MRDTVTTTNDPACVAGTSIGKISVAQPAKHFVNAGQVAGTTLLLTRPDAAQITGVNLSVDGGWTTA